MESVPITHCGHSYSKGKGPVNDPAPPFPGSYHPLSSPHSCTTLPKEAPLLWTQCPPCNVHPGGNSLAGGSLSILDGLAEKPGACVKQPESNHWHPTTVLTSQTAWGQKHRVGGAALSIHSPLESPGKWAQCVLVSVGLGAQCSFFPYRELEDVALINVHWALICMPESIGACRGYDWAHPND